MNTANQYFPNLNNVWIPFKEKYFLQIPSADLNYVLF